MCLFRHKTPHEALWVRVERCPPRCQHGTRLKPSAPLACPCLCKCQTRGKFLFQTLVSSLVVVILTSPQVSSWVDQRMWSRVFVFRDSVNHLLEENQRYLSQLTSLLQETTEEKSESIMVSAFCRFIMKLCIWSWPHILAAVTLCFFLSHRFKTGAGLNTNPWLLNHNVCRVMVNFVTGSNKSFF